MVRILSRLPLAVGLAVAACGSGARSTNTPAAPPTGPAAARVETVVECPAGCFTEGDRGCVKIEGADTPPPSAGRSGYPEAAYVSCPGACCPPIGTGDDPDGDGVLGASDHCADTPEDWDGWQDQDGCPDADNDGDGIEDAQDRCRREAEDRDGDQDDDGCPE